MVKKVGQKSIQSKDVDKLHPISLFSDNKLRRIFLNYTLIYEFSSIFLLNCVIIGVSWNKFNTVLYFVE
jgi:hypothetical protein